MPPSPLLSSPLLSSPLCLSPSILVSVSLRLYRQPPSLSLSLYHPPSLSLPPPLSLSLFFSHSVSSIDPSLIHSKDLIGQCLLLSLISRVKCEEENSVNQQLHVSTFHNGGEVPPWESHTINILDLVKHQHLDRSQKCATIFKINKFPHATPLKWKSEYRVSSVRLTFLGFVVFIWRCPTIFSNNGCVHARKKQSEDRSSFML